MVIVKFKVFFSGFHDGHVYGRIARLSRHFQYDLYRDIIATGQWIKIKIWRKKKHEYDFVKN